MSKCKFVGEFCPFTSSRVFKTLKQKAVTFYDSLHLALNANAPIELLIAWAKRHLKEDDILITTRGSMTITSMISQIYQEFQVRKAWLERDKIKQEMKLFEQVHEKYKGPSENAILVEIAKRKNLLELAKLYEPDSKPEPVAYHEELIRQYERSTEDLIEQRRAKEEHSREAFEASESESGQNPPPPSSGTASPNLDDWVNSPPSHGGFR